VHVDASVRRRPVRLAIARLPLLSVSLSLSYSKVDFSAIKPAKHGAAAIRGEPVRLENAIRGKSLREISALRGSASRRSSRVRTRARTHTHTHIHTHTRHSRPASLCSSRSSVPLLFCSFPAGHYFSRMRPIRDKRQGRSDITRREAEFTFAECFPTTCTVCLPYRFARRVLFVSFIFIYRQLSRRMNRRDSNLIDRLTVTWRQNTSKSYDVKGKEECNLIMYLSAVFCSLDGISHEKSGKTSRVLAAKLDWPLSRGTKNDLDLLRFRRKKFIRQRMASLKELPRFPKRDRQLCRHHLERRNTFRLSLHGIFIRTYILIRVFSLQ